MRKTVEDSPKVAHNTKQTVKHKNTEKEVDAYITFEPLTKAADKEVKL